MKDINANMLLGFNINPYFIKALNSPEEIKLIENGPAADDERYAEFGGNFDFLDEICGIDIDDYQTMVFADELTMQKFLRFSEISGYKYKVYRADKMIFQNMLDLSKAGQDLKDRVREFILRHFNVNDVLDKMNEGLKLTEYDYQILKSV